MFRLIFTPEWFNGYDLLFEGIALIVAFLIAAYSWRTYRISKENRFMYFSIAFMLISLSLAVEMFTQGVLYFFPVRETIAQVLGPVTGSGLKYADLYYRGAFFIQMASLLGGWLLIFFISQKPRNRLKKFYELTQMALFIYLVLLISVISNFKYVIFYLTSSVLLGLIVLNYYQNYLNTNRNKNAFLVMFSFLLILFGNLFLVFVFLNNGFYVAGELLILLGFLLLLYAYRNIVNK